MSPDAATSDKQLTIELDPRHVPVSYLSSLLRVMQAALREVAMTGDTTRRRFQKRPQPILVLSSLDSDGAFKIGLRFESPRDSDPLGDLSSKTFDAFLDRFIEFATTLPQPGLWGGSPGRLPRQDHESEMSRRMDQVHRELRRSPKITVRFRERFVEIEGDRMEFA